MSRAKLLNPQNTRKKQTRYFGRCLSGKDKLGREEEGQEYDNVHIRFREWKTDTLCACRVQLRERYALICKGRPHPIHMFSTSDLLLQYLLNIIQIYILVTEILMVMEVPKIYKSHLCPMSNSYNILETNIPNFFLIKLYRGASMLESEAEAVSVK